MKKISQTHIIETDIVDAEGNTIESRTETKTKLSKTEQEPRYVKMYLDDFRLLQGLSATESAILHELLYLMQYATNEVVVLKDDRELIAENCKTTDGMVKQTLRKLVDKDILKRKPNRGKYIVNPKFFGRGSWRDVQELRITLEYNNHGRSFNLEEIMK